MTVIGPNFLMLSVAGMVMGERDGQPQNDWVKSVDSMTHECDVVIAGGSLASAAAAVAAGEASTSTSVCFIEITDWPGGQASAGGIPAMDFGLQYLNFPRNIPRTLAQLLTDGKMGPPDYNPGECQYLPKCFAPEWPARWLLDRLAALPNVAVFLNTTVVKVDRDAAGRVTALQGVQRTPTPTHPSGWDRPLSNALPDCIHRCRAHTLTRCSCSSWLRLQVWW